MSVVHRSYRQTLGHDAGMQAQSPNQAFVKLELVSILLQQFSFQPEKLLIQDADASDDTALMYQDGWMELGQVRFQFE